MSGRGWLIGGVAAVVGLGAVALLFIPAPGPRKVIGPAASATPDEPPATGVCALDIGALSIDVRPDPGFGNPELKPVVPVLRTHMPARLKALVCPSTDCTLPPSLEPAMWISTGDEWARSEQSLEPLPRGRCRELQLQSTAGELWPDAEPGVVRWALVLGSPSSGTDLEAFRGVGGVVWMGDVVHAGVDGTPNVH